MNIAIYQVTEIEHYDETNQAPEFIIWDLDERKRLSVAENYKKAMEIVQDWKKIKGDKK